MLFITIWIIAAFTVAWIASLRLTEDEEDVTIKPCSTVCWPNAFHSSPNHNLPIGTGEWNCQLTPGLLVWQRPGPTHSRPPWIFIRMLLWIHSCLSWVGPPKWETNASLNLWRYMERCPGPVHLSANTDWRTPWMSSTIGGAMSVYCMLVAVNNGIVCWHCIRHIDIWSSAGLIRNISHFD